MIANRSAVAVAAGGLVVGSIALAMLAPVFFQSWDPASGAWPGGDANPGLVFAFAGDSGTGDRHERRIGRRMAELHRSRPLSGIFLLGDNLYGEDPFAIAMEERFFDPFEPLIDDGVPFFAALGNHDNDNADRWSGELEAAVLNMEGRPYYSETFGDGLVTFFVLSSETIQDDPDQVEWLRSEVDRCDSEWMILTMHRPMVASHIGNGPSGWLYRLLEEIIIEGGIDLVVTGHNHVYERRESVDGIVHLTVGSSGELLEDEEFPPDEGRAVGYNDARAFAWIEIREDGLRLQAVNEFGEVVDEHFIPGGS